MQHSRKSLKPEVHVIDTQRILVKNTGIVSADVQELKWKTESKTRITIRSVRLGKVRYEHTEHYLTMRKTGVLLSKVSYK